LLDGPPPVYGRERNGWNEDMTATKLILALAAAVTLGACSSHSSYWADKINEMPRWQQVKCRFALVDNKPGEVRTFCPKGMPSP
jgi:hypothetical protein